MYPSEVAAVSAPYNAQSAPIAWRYGGNQMKRWRIRANVSREELGAASNYAPDTIKAMEQGVRMPTARVLDMADRLCRADGLLSAAKDYLQRERFPARSQDFMLWEESAVSHCSYEPILIPGLLQTEAYARALIGCHWPPLEPETVEDRVTARLERRRIFARKPPVAFSFVMYESALSNPLVDRQQLCRLLTVGKRFNVALQVLPFSRSVPVALLGPMVLLADRDHDRAAYQDGAFASELTTDAGAVSVVAERLSMIRAEALSSAESARFLERMVHQL